MRLWPWLLSLALAGCGDDLGIERLRPNTPPETSLRSGPPDSTATDYSVQMQWSGSDPDGAVDHFDVIVVDHPAAQSHIGGDPGDDDSTRVVVTVPSVDDPRWRGTTASESTFVTLADTLRRDPRPGPGETPDDVRRTLFERWHTVFVRAVDDRGLPDPTPDYVTFNATNLAPTVALDAPVVPGQRYETPTTAYFTWDGDDPVDETTSKAPVAARWVMIPSRFSFSFPFPHYVAFPDSLYTLPPGSSWSEWQAWDRADGSGRHAVIPGLREVGLHPDVGKYIFAVQAMDEAGAVTPVFDWTTPGKNNVAIVAVNRRIAPLLVLHEPILGTFVFTGASDPDRLDIPAGQILAFRWQGDASAYGGVGLEYRYGWDLLDPSGDDGWTGWSADLHAAPRRSFTAGTHRFYLQMRDGAGTQSQAILELATAPLTRRRAVLWVDDTDFLNDTSREIVEDTRWVQVLGAVAAASGFDFNPTLDVYDVILNRREAPPIQKVLDYAAIVWSVRSGQDRSSALRRLAQYFDPYAARNHNGVRNYSYLFSYLGCGGCLWVNGFRPAKQLWPDVRAEGEWYSAVNVTNWDDPVDPHPGIDSVGTTSLLYRMGVEMFDVGASLEIRRSEREHYCYGLRRGDVDGAPELAVGPEWAQAGTGGRPNVEIYNMPVALSTQMPPLLPPADRTVVPYTYVSHVPVDLGAGIVYPETADHQPVFVLAKGAATEPYFSRAFCGFEVYLLGEESHLELTRFVLGQAFRITP